MSHIASVDAVVHPVFLVRADADSGMVRLFGELDIASAPALLREATERLQSHRSIGVDIGSLMFIDAAGLGALVTLRNRCVASGLRLDVAGASPSMARVFGLAGLADLLTHGDVAAVM